MRQKKGLPRNFQSAGFGNLKIEGFKKVSLPCFRFWNSSSQRKIALAAGVLYLIAFVSVPTVFLYDPVLNDPNCIAGAGAYAVGIGKALIVLYTWFRFGQNLIPALNALLLGFLLYRSRPVPRILPLLIADRRLERLQETIRAGRSRVVRREERVSG